MTPDGLRVSVTIASAVEGPIAVELDLGRRKRPESLLEFAALMPVRMEGTIRSGRPKTTSTDVGSGLQRYNSSMTHDGSQPIFMLAQRHGLVTRKRRDAGEDPLFAWTGIVLDCSSLKSIAQKDSATSKPSTAAAKAKKSELTVDAAHIARTKHIGTAVTWTGPLEKLQCRNGETHFLVGVTESSFSQRHFEAFTRHKDFYDEVADYVSRKDGTDSGDTVTVSGRVAAQNAGAFRVDASSAQCVLVELIQIERVGKPASRAVVGQHRASDSFDAARMPSGLAEILRNWPEIGLEARFSAEFQNAYTAGKVRVTVPGVSLRSAEIAFPAATKATFADYEQVRGPVEIVAVMRGTDNAFSDTLKFDGRSIVRPGNPHSRVTDQGREFPAIDFSKEKQLWEEIRTNTSQTRSNHVVLAGLFAGLRETSNGFTVTLNHLFHGYEHQQVDLNCENVPAAAAAWLKRLKPRDELWLEAVVTGRRFSNQSIKPLWIAGLGAPQVRIPFVPTDP